MKVTQSLIAAAILAALPLSAMAQSVATEVQRNINQQQRIKQGIRSGELTNREVAKLEHGQARVERREARAGADGEINRREQHRIQSAEYRQSNRIYRQKHDRQERAR